MIVRTKSGDYGIQGKTALFDFLGLGRREQGIGSGGRIKITDDIELIAPAPFCLSNDGGEDGATPDGIAAISNEIAWTFSTFDLDRYAERIDPAGWDFKRFLHNPVIEWAHRYDIPAIGKAGKVYANDRGLHGTIVFNAKDFDPFGWAIGERVKAGVIRAGSVGFRVLEIEIPGKEESKDGTTLIFRKQELLEFSICNVPANPCALAKSGETQSGSADFFGGLFGRIGNGE